MNRAVACVVVGWLPWTRPKGRPMANTAEALRALRARRGAAGLCQKCGLTSTLKRLCEPCRLLEVRGQADRRTRLRTEGCCLDCGRKLTEFYARCWSCRVRAWQSDLERRPDCPPWAREEPSRTTVDSKAKRDRRKAQGRCTRCNAVLEGSGIRCPTCSADHRGRQAKGRANKAQEEALRRAQPAKKTHRRRGKRSAPTSLRRAGAL